MRTPEAVVKDKIKAVLKKLGIFYYMPVQTGYGVAGLSDFIMCVDGRFVAIEAKAGNIGEGTENQKRFMAKVVAASGHAWIINAFNIHQLEGLLKNLLEEEELCRISLP